MKIVYGLLIMAFAAVLVLWAVGTEASRFQVDPGPIAAPSDVYDPVREGEATPPGFRQLLRRDSIFPVYNPTFKTVGETDWDNETLIIGVALGGEAKAYPVSFLNRREMVIDWIGGTPVLVSW